MAGKCNMTPESHFNETKRDERTSKRLGKHVIADSKTCSEMKVLSEVIAAATMNFTNFCDTAPCSPCVDRCFGETYHLHLQGRKSSEQESGV
jgi:hypothetical protein